MGRCAYITVTVWHLRHMFGNVRRVTLLVSSVKDSCLLGRDRLMTIIIDCLFFKIRDACKRKYQQYFAKAGKFCYDKLQNCNKPIIFYLKVKIIVLHWNLLEQGDKLGLINTLSLVNPREKN